MPLFSVATARTIGGCQPSRGITSESIAINCCSRRSAPSRSALFKTKMSPISMSPAFMFWMSSPSPGTSITSTQSASRTMSISSWPTPTVSINTCFFPAASSNSATSAVARARPPRNPRVAIERINVPASPACPCMRTRSPRMAPPEYGLVGSTAITPTSSFLLR